MESVALEEDRASGFLVDFSDGRVDLELLVVVAEFSPDPPGEESESLVGPDILEVEMDLLRELLLDRDLPLGFGRELFHLGWDAGGAEGEEKNQEEGGRGAEGYDGSPVKWLAGGDITIPCLGPRADSEPETGCSSAGIGMHRGMCKGCAILWEGWKQ